MEFSHAAAGALGEFHADLGGIITMDDEHEAHDGLYSKWLVTFVPLLSRPD